MVIGSSPYDCTAALFPCPEPHDLCWHSRGPGTLSSMRCAMQGRTCTLAICASISGDSLTPADASSAALPTSTRA